MNFFTEATGYEKTLFFDLQGAWECLRAAVVEHGGFAGWDRCRVCRGRWGCARYPHRPKALWSSPHLALAIAIESIVFQQARLPQLIKHPLPTPLLEAVMHTTASADRARQRLPNESRCAAQSRWHPSSDDHHCGDIAGTTALRFRRCPWNQAFYLLPHRLGQTKSFRNFRLSTHR